MPARQSTVPVHSAYLEPTAVDAAIFTVGIITGVFNRHVQGALL